MVRQPASHRLLVGAERWARLRSLPDVALVQHAAETLAGQVDGWVADRTITVDETGHNWHLIRARQAQTRVVSLLVHYGATGDRRSRDAALAYVGDIAGWEYWSWITWRQSNPDPNAIFDLSYGENSLTLALVCDWLADELSEPERALLVDTARARAFDPYIACNGTPGQESRYYRRPDSNWNTVCNGGAGTLAMALADACPESARVLDLAEEGVRHYFAFLDDDGAWPEGIGYWAYGHRYGYYYLLSHERAHGRPHRLLERPGSRATLRFPLLFSPNGVPASFGDVNRYFPLPFHYAAAERFGMADVTAELDRRLQRLIADDPAALTDGSWPNPAELLLFHPGAQPAGAVADWPDVSVQKGLEWSYLADRWPQPRLYASVRGGTTDAPHTHQDLLSLFVVVGDRALVHNVGAERYIDTTFSPRRFELYEHAAASKNTLLVNGVGAPQPATVATRHLRGPSDGAWEGVLLDATGAYDGAVGSPVRLCGRAVLLLAGAALLLLDRVALEHTGLAEARFHTLDAATLETASAQVEGGGQALHLAFAASVPARLRRGLGLSTLADSEPPTVLRWMTGGAHREMTLATLLTPNGTGTLRLDADAGRVRASGPGFDVTVGYPADELDVR